MLIEFWWGNLW